MNESERQEFEDGFRAAISASLGVVKVTDELKSRLLARLQEEAPSSLPEGIDEAVVSGFQEQLSFAVARSQDWSPECRVVLQAESAVSAELGSNVLSERSVSALLDGAEPPSQLNDLPVPQEKILFIKSLRSEIRRSSQELTAPLAVREKILLSLASQNRSKVVPFPSKLQWTRGLSALTSLAAGFAVIFFTLFGSADVALANSVRADHQNCCRATMKSKVISKSETEATFQSELGVIPIPVMDDSWTLRVSRVCHDDSGEPMIHLLYSRESDGQAPETLSFHFIPGSKNEKARRQLKNQEPQEISGGDFPVIAWLEGDWICTVCSPDLDADALRGQASAGL